MQYLWDNFYAIFSENWWFQTKRFTGLLELIQLYKQNPLEKFFIFTIYNVPILYIGFKRCSGSLYVKPSCKSHIWQFSRNQVGRGYLVVVTGSSRQLQALCGCYRVTWQSSGKYPVWPSNSHVDPTPFCEKKFMSLWQEGLNMKCD